MGILTIVGRWMLVRLWIRAWLRPDSSRNKASFFSSISLFSSSMLFKFFSIEEIWGRQTQNIALKQQHRLTAEPEIIIVIGSSDIHLDNGGEAWGECFLSAVSVPCLALGWTGSRTELLHCVQLYYCIHGAGLTCILSPDQQPFSHCAVCCCCKLTSWANLSVQVHHVGLHLWVGLIQLVNLLVELLDVLIVVQNWVRTTTQLANTISRTLSVLAPQFSD